MLAINNLNVSVGENKILRGLNLEINMGEVHVILGKNGSGKSTLANTIMGHPNYEITSGDINFNGQSIKDLPVDARAKIGIFLAFQNPLAIPGVQIGNFLRATLRTLNPDAGSSADLRKQIKANASEIGIPKEFLGRYLNDGFSGGEKKRLEILQLKLAQPKLAILDETDSGLDVDAFKTVAETIKSMRSPSRSFLIITHYRKLLDIVDPDFVHVLIDGQIVKSGRIDLADQIETEGYESFANAKIG